MGRAWWGVWIGIVGVHCGEEPCDEGSSRCEGDRRQTCIVGSEGARWEEAPCPDGSVCLSDGRCGALPLIPCEAGVDYERCDATNRIPGVCTDGVWLFDRDWTCRPGERCITGLDQTVEPPVPRALCVLDPPSLCNPRSAMRFCHDDLLCSCSSVGYLVVEEDCRKTGAVCRAGACVR